MVLKPYAVILTQVSLTENFHMASKVAGKVLTRKGNKMQGIELQGMCLLGC